VAKFGQFSSGVTVPVSSEAAKKRLVDIYKASKADPDGGFSAATDEAAAVIEKIFTAL